MEGGGLHYQATVVQNAVERIIHTHKNAGILLLTLFAAVHCRTLLKSAIEIETLHLIRSRSLMLVARSNSVQ